MPALPPQITLSGQVVFDLLVQLEALAYAEQKPSLDHETAIGVTIQDVLISLYAELFGDYFHSEADDPSGDAGPVPLARLIEERGREEGKRLLNEQRQDLVERDPYAVLHLVDPLVTMVEQLVRISHDAIFDDVEPADEDDWSSFLAEHPELDDDAGDQP